MKKSHEFPEDQVRAAIRAGVARARDEDSVLGPRRVGKRYGRKVIYTLGSVAAVFVLLVGSSYFSPTLASSLSQIPIIGSVFGNSDLISLREAQKNGLTTAVGETQTVDGISVTLDEILYDQNNITIGLYIESEEELGEFYFGSGMDFTIDGSLPSGATGSYGEEILSATTRTAIEEINVTEEMPDEFELGLVLHGEDGKTWYFSTPVEKISDVAVIPVDHTQSVDGVELSVTEVAVSQTGVSVVYESVEEEVDFDLSRGGNIEFLMEDQDGNEIEGRSGGVTGELVDDRIVYTSRKQFDPIDDGVTELTITPYVVVPSEGGGVEIDEDGVEKELEFKGDLIKPIEFAPFTVEIPK